jgi:endonuclease/exonuclease/phosphatase family metal-dependent hydrolase
MKQIFVLFFFISSTVISQPLHVMSFNIRLNVKSDSLNAWPFRKDLVAAQVLFHEIHLLGVQEALHEQMLDLQQRLPDFKYAGVARDDGKQKGEYSAIFYDTARLKLLHSETFWLSESPTIPGSKSWDAAITRVVTWAKLLDRKSGIMFFAFNTHFDHMGKEARRQSARLILEKVHAIAGHIPVIISKYLPANRTVYTLQIQKTFLKHRTMGLPELLMVSPIKKPVTNLLILFL